MSGVETFTQTKSFLGVFVTHPGGGELRSPPPANISRSAHRTRTHTGQTDPHGTRNMHTEPHGTSTRDAHKGPQACISSFHMFAALSLVSLAPWAVLFACSLLLSMFALCSVAPLAHGMSMRPYSANAELTGSLHRDRPSTSPRCRHGLT